MEIEAKFFVNHLERIAERLDALGAQLRHPRTLEQNWRYDTPERTLDAGQRLLRLRKSHKVTLTYKSSAEEVGGTSQRQEYETEVSDIGQTRLLLEALGYVVTERYEKYRTEYDLGGLYITLDELPFGDFVEIEGQFVTDIQGCAADLGLDWEANITENYLLLFRRLRKVIPVAEGQLTFEALAGKMVGAEALGVRAAD